MDYKQHKGELRGQIKNQVERRLYNKSIRKEPIIVDVCERQSDIPDAVCHFTPCLDQYGGKCINGSYWKTCVNRQFLK